MNSESNDTHTSNLCGTYHPPLGTLAHSIAKLSHASAREQHRRSTMQAFPPPEEKDYHNRDNNAGKKSCNDPPGAHTTTKDADKHRTADSQMWRRGWRHKSAPLPEIQLDPGRRLAWAAGNKHARSIMEMLHTACSAFKEEIMD